MRPIRIKRRYSGDLAAKEALRAYVDQMPFDQQHAFVTLATQMIQARQQRLQTTFGDNPRQFMPERQHLC